VQDRITDHRLVKNIKGGTGTGTVGGNKFGMEKMLRGEFLTQFYDQLVQLDRADALAALSRSDSARTHTH